MTNFHKIFMISLVLALFLCLSLQNPVYASRDNDPTKEQIKQLLKEYEKGTKLTDREMIIIKEFIVNNNPEKIVYPAYFTEQATVVLEEQFTTGALPTGWQNIDNIGGGEVWAFNNPGSRTFNSTTSANGFAIFDSDFNGSSSGLEDADLITPPIDCSTLSVVKIQFEQYFRAGFGGAGELSVSPDNGANWVSLDTWGASSTPNAELKEYDVSSIAAGQSQVLVKWNWTGDYSWYWMLDDIYIYEPGKASNYISTYSENAGNPGGLNTESDAPGLGTWTTIVAGPQSSNIWSPVQAIPFPFEFYGVPVTHFKASQNGLVTFDTSTTVLPSGANTNLPSDSLPDLTIATMWDEFTASPPTGSGDDVRINVFGTAPNRQLWIKWYSFEIGNPTVSFAYFACVIEESSNNIYIVDQYSTTAASMTATVGLQLNNTTAVQYGDSLIADNGNGSGNADNDFYSFFVPWDDDIGVTDVTAVPTDWIAVPGTPVDITAIVQNFGLNPLADFDVNYSVNDGSSGSETVVDTLYPGEKDTINFTTQWVPSSSGTFTVTAEAPLIGDGNIGNNNRATDLIVYGENLNYSQDFTGYTGNPSSIQFFGADNQGFGTFVPSLTTDGAWTPDGFGNNGTTGSARFNFWSTTSSDQDWMITPPMDMTTSGPGNLLSFDVAATEFSTTNHAFIPTGDTLFVAVSTDGQNWPRSNIIGQFTDQDSIPAAGMTVSIDLSAYNSETSLYIAFIALDPPNAGDMNVYIDNVFVGVPPTLDMGPTALVTPVPGFVYGANEDVVVTVQNFSTLSIDFSVDNMTVNVDISGASTQNFSTVVNTGTLDPDSTLDVLVTSSCDLTAAGQHDFTITTVVAGDGNPANDVLTASIVSQAIVSTFPYFEHFDSTTAGVPGTLPAGWQNVPGDDHDWYVESSGTQNSTNTGPLNDNSGTGNYMYVESSSPYFPGVVANLHSPGFDISGLTNPTLYFYFHMYGADMGELHVDVYSNGTWTLDAMAPLVGQYQTAETAPWIRTSVNLTGYTSPVLVRFRGITGANFTSDMAVDDVTVGEVELDIAANMITMPKLTMTPLSQTSLVSNLPFEGIFSNLGPANTGDINLSISDEMGTVVHSEALTGVTINAFSDSLFAFTPVNAAGADSGRYDITMYSSNFTDVNAANDTMMLPHVLGDQMAFDFGVQSTSGTFSATARSWFAIRYTLSDPDTLRNVKILVSASTVATDSFAVELWSVVNDSPDVAILSIYEGVYSDLGTLPALVSFDIPGGYALPAGDFAVVFDMKNTNSYPCGIDFTAMGAGNIPNTFWGKLESTTWLAFENVGAATWTPIIRATFNLPGAPPISYTESFEDPSFPPMGWGALSPDGGTGWERQIVGTSPVPGWNGGTVTGVAGGDTAVAFCTWTTGGAVSNDQWLTSPQLMDVQSGEFFSFWMRYWPDSYNDTLDVYLSTTDPSSPANFTIHVDQLGFGAGSDTNWVMYNYDLTNYVAPGSNVYVGFQEHVVDNFNYGASFSIDLFQTNADVNMGGPTVEFFDDFENGTTNWTLAGGWGLTDQVSYSPTHSLTESPSGNYPPNQNISATMVSGVDLSAALDATVSFYARYNIEQGFDYMYVEVSANGGPWVQIAVFDGEGFNTFEQYSYSMGGFVGNPDVKVRFRFFSDGGYEVDGMYIDDFMITSTNVDNTPPLIVHEGPEFYEGTLEDVQVMTEIVDISGLASANVLYTVDGGSFNSLNPDSSAGNMYYFTIPMQAAGVNVDYWITATDNATNVDTVGIFSYLAGNHLIYDNGDVTFVNQLLAGNGCAVRATIPAGSQADLSAILIRNYTDINRPNDSMMVHIWADAGGLPGADLVTPFAVFPEATLTNTSPMTRVDLRPYAAQLSGLTGDFFIGFTVPSGSTNGVWITQTTPGTFGRTFNFTGGTWASDTDDYHFRAIIGDTSTVGIAGMGDLIPDEFALYQNYPNPFNPTTTIKYALKENADVSIKIYNLLGQEVRTLVNTRQEAGYKTVVWNGLNNGGARVASGIYIYRIEAGDFVQARKMILMK